MYDEFVITVTSGEVQDDLVECLFVRGRDYSVRLEVPALDGRQPHAGYLLQEEKHVKDVTNGKIGVRACKGAEPKAKIRMHQTLL